MKIKFKFSESQKILFPSTVEHELVELQKQADIYENAENSQENIMKNWLIIIQRKNLLNVKKDRMNGQLRGWGV